MSLTKEECLQSLCRIQCGAKQDKKCKDCKCFDNKVNIWKCVENTKESLILRELIHEHFELVDKYNELEEQHMKLLSQWGKSDNPPLKFEELHEGMWVWDNKNKMFIKIYDVATLEENCFSFVVFGWEVPIYDEQFEENCFYRKQVEDDES